MKAMLLGGLGAAAIGTGVYNLSMDTNTGENVYEMSQSSAISMLSETPLPIGYGPFSAGNVEADVASNNALEWSSGDADDGLTCRAETTSVGTDQVSVKAYCQSNSDSTLTSMNTMVEIKNMEFREFVDATLTGRKYDKAKIDMAKMRITAVSIPTMANDASKLKDEFTQAAVEADETISDAAADAELLAAENESPAE
jgi:hypothetical protein